MKNEMINDETINALLAGRCHIGFRYKFDHYHNGILVSSDVVDNIIPTAAITYLLGAALNGAGQLSSWYIGIYTNNYTPLAADTMANFPTDAGEITTNYTESTRPALTPDAIAAGLWSNAGTPANFTFNATDTVRGGFIASNGTKGGLTGTLLSAVLAGTAKPVVATDVLKVTAGLTLTSA